MNANARVLAKLEICEWFRVRSDSQSIIHVNDLASGWHNSEPISYSALILTRQYISHNGYSRNLKDNMCMWVRRLKIDIHSFYYEIVETERETSKEWIINK